MRHFLPIVFAIILLSCEKDPSFTDEDFAPDNLASFLMFTDTSKLSESSILMGGNHPSFEEENDDLPIRMLFNAPDGWMNVKLFMTDSLQYRDSLEVYRLKTSTVVPNGDGLFVAINRSDLGRDRFAIVYFESGDSTYQTNPVALRATTLETQDIEGIQLTHTESKSEIYWTAPAGADQYLVTIRSIEGGVISSIFTKRTAFTFYDLRFAQRNLTPSLNNPYLVEGQSYSLEIIAVTNRMWMNGYTEQTFTVDYE